MSKELYNYSASLSKVVSGDTIDVLVDLGFDIFKLVRVRMDRIKGFSTKSTDPEEKQLAGYSIRYLKKMLTSKELLIQTRKNLNIYDMYFAEINVKIGEEIININDVLIDVGYAEPIDDLGGVSLKGI